MNDDYKSAVEPVYSIPTENGADNEIIWRAATRWQNWKSS